MITKDKKLNISIVFRKPTGNYCCTISSVKSKMSKKKFLKHCEDFFDSYKTGLNDYSQMFIDVEEG